MGHHGGSVRPLAEAGRRALKFTVAWHPRAEYRLAEIWLDSGARDAIRAAADEIERTLRFSPRAHAEKITSRLGSLRRGVLEVLFEVRDDDCLVRITAVRLVDGDD